MADIVKYKLLFPSFETSIGLYENINNLSEIHGLTQTQDICLINAKTIFEINQILCAINKSICSQINNKLITKRLNSEILFNLSPNKNISESLKTFGVNQSDDSLPIIALIVNQINDSNQTINREIFDKISGKLLPISSLKDLRNDSLIDQIYKLNNNQNESSKWDRIISKIATKDII